MSENTPRSAPPTMVAALHPDPQPWRPTDAGRCSLHQATIEPTHAGRSWPSTPGLSGERCLICKEIDRLLASGKLPF